MIVVREWMALPNAGKLQRGYMCVRREDHSGRSIFTCWLTPISLFMVSDQQIIFVRDFVHLSETGPNFLMIFDNFT